MFAAVSRIADEAAVTQIHDKIKVFQRQLPDQNRHVVGRFEDIHRAELSLDGETHGFVQIGFGFSFEVGNPFGARAAESKLSDESGRQRQ